MPSFETGSMFWGKSLSYPWWPCVIVPNDKYETFRNRKKLGFQYHVQFIGSDYDVCWITDGFLIEYLGKEHFESYVEQHLINNSSAQDKVKFDMRMSSSIQALWVQACQDAERLYPMNTIDRLASLPKAPIVNQISASNDASNVESGVGKKSRRNQSIESLAESIPDKSTEFKDITTKPKPKRKTPKRSVSKDSDYEDESDVDSDPQDVVNRRSKKKKTSVYKESEDEYDNESDFKVGKRNKKRNALKRPFPENKTSVENGTSQKAVIDEHVLSRDIEERCYNAYMAKEICHRLNSPMEKSTLENILREQWAALDVDLKLSYLNDEVCYSGASQSKVSGRKIKLPSKWRRTEDIAKIKRRSLKSRSNEPPMKKFCSTSSVLSSAVSVKTENVDMTSKCELSLSPKKIDTPKHGYLETINKSLWNSMTSEDCLSEIMRIVIMKSLPEIGNICCYCFKAISSLDKAVVCKGDCQSSYHLMCAVENKIIRSDDISLCVNCNHKNDLCCICKNSKYMKKQLLIKCQKEDCVSYFHVTCVKFLTFIEQTVNAKTLIFCPKHSCLTCTREDNKHNCNDIGTFLSCIKCPITYHANLVCIPAGCRIISKHKLICYRHFDNSFILKKAQQLSRCFICFNEHATLKCCRCRAIFHPKCMSLATYTDLLRDYVCTTCKLEKPMFQGQIVWLEANKKWVPAELVNTANLKLGDENEKLTKTMAVRLLESNEIYVANRCELIPYVIGVSVLKDCISVTDPVVQLAKIRDYLYWNWRARLRPLIPDTYKLIGQTDLLKHSVNNYRGLAQTVDTYEYLDHNVVPENIQKLISSYVSENCDCASTGRNCSDENCHNFKNNIECTDSNCKRHTCRNRIFAQSCIPKPIIIKSSISSRGVILNANVNENQLLGECTGAVVLEQDVLAAMYNRDQLESVSYIFPLFRGFYLNCEHFGNEWRYVNHSCEPNAKVVCKNVSGSLKLGIVSLKPISVDEVTIDYRESVVLKYGFVCHCQSALCCQIVGPTSIFATDSTTFVTPLCCSKSDNIITPQVLIPPNSVLNRRMSNIALCEESVDNSVLDDRVIFKTSCYKCGTHGELITCDRNNCHKQYHMTCIELATRPTGLWLCPLHFCCQCNCAATIFCDNCPISSCKKHAQLHFTHNCTMNPASFQGHDELSQYQEVKKEKSADSNNDSYSAVSEKKEACVVEDVNRAQEPVEEVSFEERYEEYYVEKEETVEEEDTDVYNAIACAVEYVGHHETVERNENSLEMEEIVFEDVPTIECLEEVKIDRNLLDQSNNDGTNAAQEKDIVELDTGVNKEALYEACDLIPVVAGGENSVIMNGEVGIVGFVDYEDLRFEMMPSKIEEMEDTIISPCIIDD